MGCNTSAVAAEKVPAAVLDSVQKNKEIEKQLAFQAKRDSMKFKLLLLGTGESGKSTIFKQLKAIYGELFNEDDCIKVISTIHANVIEGMRSLVQQVKLQNKLQYIQDKESLEFFQKCRGKMLDRDISNAIRNLWTEPIIQVQWERRSEFQLIESVQRYFDKIDVIGSSSYAPDFYDILHSRMRTSGISCEAYNIDGVMFEIYDVGGQRNERKKWIHCFEGVSAILYVCALSEYDQSLFEDSSVNRMIESLNIFEEICNNTFFQTTSMILFMNKKDLFEQKIKTSNIRDVSYFSDYSGPDCDFNAGVEYFVKKFLARNKIGTFKNVYYHVTCATETSSVKSVMVSCCDIVIRESLSTSGFIE